MVRFILDNDVDIWLNEIHIHVLILSEVDNVTSKTVSRTVYGINKTKVAICQYKLNK